MLDRLNRVFEQAFFPAVQVRLGPIAIDALDASSAIIGDLSQQAGYDLRCGIVAVDQQRKCSGAVYRHCFSLPFE